MQQRAVVTKVLGHNLAEIEVVRQSACGHDCEKCGGGCMEALGRVKAQARNPVHAKIGDEVQVEGENKQVFRAAFVVYLVPFILFFLAYGLASQSGLTENPCILIGAAGFFLGILAAIAYNQNVRRKQSIVFTITKRFSE